jgi:hypothetical protein
VGAAQLPSLLQLHVSSNKQRKLQLQLFHRVLLHS